MGTRAVVSFCTEEKERVRAQVFYPTDGNPESMLHTLQDFFSVVRNSKNNRLGDATSLAAQFIVYQTQREFELQKKITDRMFGIDKVPLVLMDCGSAAIVEKIPPDVEFVYFVVCHFAEWPDEQRLPDVDHLDVRKKRPVRGGER